ncbi:hypothetical protein GUJ93_ZPchr0009g2118 [Zizania palustris]|uniref:Uncharacterized protein n=1 Tax=Zizania palustris TaxID=103762 RepID=A0A8J5R318_ZIZPA|nr:hypothetical protein GUJ93_ZPchr0009g2118 [Zizania palustris]
MSSHEFHEAAANHVEVEPAADRHEDIAATKMLLNDDQLWFAMIANDPERRKNIMAAGDRPAGGGACADFFDDSLARAPPPVLAQAAAIQSCTPHGADIPVLPPGSPTTTNARRAADLAMEETVRETALPANALIQHQHQSAGVGSDTPAVVVVKTEKGHGKGRNVVGPVSSKRRAVWPIPAYRDTPAIFDGMMEEGHHGNVRNDGPVSSKRRAMLADSDSPAVFVGMEEGHDNDWYESIIRDVVIQEQEDDPELRGSIPLEPYSKI